MFTKNLHIEREILVLAFFLLLSFTLQSQISIEGLISQNEGSASWDADGTGPEPYGNGHGTFLYYVASRDYVDANCLNGAHVTGIATDFSAFAQKLSEHGFTPGQVTIRVGLASQGDDLEGSDWFDFGNEIYLNFYPIEVMIYLNNELMITGLANYMVFHYGESTQWLFVCTSNYFVPVNASGSSSQAVQNVAAAFMQDVGDNEIKMILNTFGDTQDFSGNGRTGAYFNFNGSLEKGLPEIPMLGLHADNEGGAGWDADGTGHEPYGNGHDNFLYYTASVDYDDINPSSDAALCHLLDVEKGFQNTILQLQYRGFEMGDIKIKLGLASLGPDVEGEDWGLENGYHWLNNYNNRFTFELNGEPILEMMCDTNKLVLNNSFWFSHTSVGKLYDISQNASIEAQYVAKSFLKDIGTHYLELNTEKMSSAGTFTGNGRNGGFYEINEASLVALHENATFLQEGTLSGNLTLDGSPYYIEGHQWIENLQTLTIEPGVRIGVRGPYHFDVQGSLKAEGTPDHVITFTSSNPNLWWDGIDFDETPVENDTSLFNHCIFQYGLAQGTAVQYNSGGAMAMRNVDKIKIRNTVFRHNKAVLSGVYPPCGGAIASENSDILIQNCTFYDNLSEYGGAVFCYSGSDPAISRCLFYNNTAVYDAGAIQLWDYCEPFIINNTFSLNNSGNNGGAIDVYSFSNPVFVNNIFWGNEAVALGQQISITSDFCQVSITYCDVQGGKSGIGPFGIPPGTYENNIDEDPLFVDIDNYNFLLDSVAPYSPCINAGDTLTPPDPDGSPADMGCYFQDIGTGLANNTKNDLQLYPNPASFQLIILNELPANADVRIEVFNVMGQKVSEPRIISSIENKIVLDVSHLQKGTYFCKWVSGEDIRTAKFIKK